jgi:hypothetical protein
MMLASNVPLVDLRQATPLGGPGLLGFNGGLMNPGAVRTDDGILLIGKGTDCHWLHAGGPNSQVYLTGAPVLLRLDAAWRLAEPEVLQLGDDFPRVRREFEDFRLYWRDGRLWTHGVMAEIEVLPEKVTYWVARQWHAEVDLARRRLVGFTLPQIDFPQAGSEKNWCYFDQGGELLLLYSFSPFVLLVSHGGVQFRTRLRVDLHPSLASLGGFEARLSLGTNPTPYGEDYLLLMIHKFRLRGEYDRLYFHWAVLLDRRTYLPAYISSQPVFVGGEAQGPMPGVVYVMAAFEVGDDVFFSLCESDSHSSFLTLPKRELDATWIPIAR